MTHETQITGQAGSLAEETWKDVRKETAQVEPHPHRVETDALGVTEVEPWGEAVDGNRLLTELRDVLKRFVVLPPWGAETLALWVLHTYAFELRNVTAYIGIASPEKRCGKTTLLSVLSELANRAVAASNISPPALFRVIEEARPTLLIDEADTFLQAKDEMRGILNSGYTRKLAYVMRVTAQTRTGERGAGNEEEEGGEAGLRKFSCWCPKVMAAIGHLPETLMDRCIVITMQRKTVQEACERLRKLEGTTLRRKCTRFVQDHQEQIATFEPEIPQELNDRAADIWEPLLVLADLAGGEWPKLARGAAVTLSAQGPGNDIIGSLLLDILLCFAERNAKRMFSRDLLASLNQAEGRPWQEGRNGKPVTDLWLAQQLRPYGIKPKTLWIGDAAARGYLLEDFEPVFPRYISRADVEVLKAMARPVLENAEPATTHGSDNSAHEADSNHG